MSEYVQGANCVQVHSMCSTHYYKYVETGICRFGYPHEFRSRSNIILKRNQKGGGVKLTSYILANIN